MKQCIVILFLMSAFPATAQDTPLRTIVQRVTALTPAQIQRFVHPVTSDTQPMTDDEYAALEQEFFRRMNWTQDEIDWFRTTYAPLYGDPRGYVQAQMDLLDILEKDISHD